MKKLLLADYGTRFKKDPSVEELEKCLPEKISICKQWLENLKALQQEVEVQVTEQRKAALKETVSKMSSDEKEELLKLLNS